MADDLARQQELNACVHLTERKLVAEQQQFDAREHFYNAAKAELTTRDAHAPCQQLGQKLGSFCTQTPVALQLAATHQAGVAVELSQERYEQLRTMGSEMKTAGKRAELTERAPSAAGLTRILTTAVHACLL